MDKRNGKRPNMKDPGRFDYQDRDIIGCWTWVAIILVAVSIGVVIWLT